MKLRTKIATAVVTAALLVGGVGVAAPASATVRLGGHISNCHPTTGAVWARGNSIRDGEHRVTAGSAWAASNRASSIEVNSRQPVAHWTVTGPAGTTGRGFCAGR